MVNPSFLLPGKAVRLLTDFSVTEVHSKLGETFNAKRYVGSDWVGEHSHSQYSGEGSRITITDYRQPIRSTLDYSIITVGSATNTGGHSQLDVQSTIRSAPALFLAVVSAVVIIAEFVWSAVNIFGQSFVWSNLGFLFLPSLIAAAVYLQLRLMYVRRMKAQHRLIITVLEAKQIE